MKIKCNKKEFKLEIFIILITLISLIIHIIKIIFFKDKINTELILTMSFLLIVFISMIVLLNIIYIKVKNGKIYISVLDMTNKRILKDNISIKNIEKYGFASDLKININKFDIVFLTKNKRLVIPVNQFKNKDILKLLDLVEEKTNIKPTGMAKHLKERKEL